MTSPIWLLRRPPASVRGVVHGSADPHAPPPSMRTASSRTAAAHDAVLVPAWARSSATAAARSPAAQPRSARPRATTAGATSRGCCANASATHRPDASASGVADSTAARRTSPSQRLGNPRVSVAVRVASEARCAVTAGHNAGQSWARARAARASLCHAGLRGQLRSSLASTSQFRAAVAHSSSLSLAVAARNAARAGRGAVAGSTAARPSSRAREPSQSTGGTGRPRGAATHDDSATTDKSPTTTEFHTRCTLPEAGPDVTAGGGAPSAARRYDARMRSAIALALAFAALPSREARACSYADAITAVTPAGGEVPSNASLWVQLTNAERLVATLELEGQPARPLIVERVSWETVAIPLTLPRGAQARVRLAYVDPRTPEPTEHALVLVSTGEADLVAPIVAEAPVLTVETLDRAPCLSASTQLVRARVSAAADAVGIAGYLLEEVTTDGIAAHQTRARPADARAAVELEAYVEEAEGRCFRVVAVDLAGNRGLGPIACILADDGGLPLAEESCGCTSARGADAALGSVLVGMMALSRRRRRERARA